MNEVMVKFTKLLLALTLSACATPPPVMVPVVVDEPVVVPCHAVPVARPDFALRHRTTSDTLFDKTRAALIEIDQHRAYEAQLEAQMRACR